MAVRIENVVELKNNVLVAMDEKGKKVVVIPQIIFKGKRSISWKEVEKYLVRYIGKIFAVSETEDLILVDRIITILMFALYAIFNFNDFCGWSFIIISAVEIAIMAGIIVATKLKRKI